MNHQLPDDERAQVNTRLSAFLDQKQKESGLTAEEFAATMGLSRQTIAAFKKSRSFPSVETILTIKKRYPDLSLDEVMTGEAPIEAVVDKKSTGLVYTPTVHRDNEVARLTLQIQYKDQQLSDKDEIIKSVKDHNQTLKTALEVFPEVSKESTGDESSFVLGMQFANEISRPFQLKYFVQFRLKGDA